MSIARKILMGSSGGKKSTYVEDLFSTYLYKGTGSPQTITNGIDLAGEGGMTWIKSRNWTRSHNIYDTVRGVNKVIYTESTSAEVTKGPSNAASGIYQFNNNGFSIGNINGVGANGYDYSSWSFRKAPGFFDIVTYTGDNGNNRQIAHNLGSVPGCIIIKVLSKADNWAVYHRGMDATSPENYGIFLNSNGPRQSGTNWWNNTAPTATHFTVGGAGWGNENGETFVAYIFAGGPSTAATAKSIDVPSGSNLSIPDDNAWNLGQTFTIEAWVKPDNLNSNYNTIVAQADGENNWYFSILNTGTCQFHNFNGTGGSLNSLTGVIPLNEWTHIAFVCNSGTGQWYVNGKASGSTATYDVTGGAGGLTIGRQGTSWPYDGKISNLRIVNGTAVYTSSFRPPTKTLTNITNTVLLCCNDSSVTGSTVTPGTITNNNSVTSSTDSPFDDPEGFKFGEEGDQNIIKCGTYNGVPGSPINFEVEMGWEPQFFMVKNVGLSGANNEWLMWDSMRGVAAQIDPNTGGNDARLSPTESAAEYGGDDQIEFHPTGVRVTTTDGRVNGGTGARLIYIAIRRPDGYVGKPAEVGTDAFAMAYGSTTHPSINGGIPIDFAMVRQPATSENWYTGSRLTGANKVYTNITDAMSSQANFVWDYMDGWQDSSNSNYLSWMWKRGAGFDVVTYKGDGTFGHVVNHSMNKIPEMIWLKERNSAVNWYVNHTALTGGGTYASWRGALKLNGTNAEWESANVLGDFSTSTTFTLGGDSDINGNGDDYLALLFSSVDGISKVGSYDGTGSTLTVTTGFQPRFLIIKRITSSDPWLVYDTVRGWGAGSDKYLQLNDSAAEGTYDAGAPTSTGFTLVASATQSGQKYIYYAHA